MSLFIIVLLAVLLIFKEKIPVLLRDSVIILVSSIGLGIANAEAGQPWYLLFMYLGVGLFVYHAFSYVRKKRTIK